MSDFLGRMIASSRRRLAHARNREPLEEIRTRALAQRPAARLKLDRSGFDLIAEVKLRSPSAGSLVSAGTDGIEIAAWRARLYEHAGAAAISVLSEPTAFGGGLHHVAAAASAGSIPVMRKDFLVDPYQVFEARAAGASGVLVILRIVSNEIARTMIEAAAQTGMFCLLEAFDAADLARVDRLLQDRVPTSLPVLVGLNTRDLTSLDVNTGRLSELIGSFPAGNGSPVVRVAESGLCRAADADQVASLGYEMALVGSALMRTTDPVSLIKSLLEAGRRGRLRSCG